MGDVIPLYDNPPHRCDIYSSSSTTDSGGGTGISYTIAQASVPCFAPTISSSEQERFNQTQLVTQHEIHFKTSTLTVTLVRGMKIIVSGASLHITGIVVNPAAGGVPSLAKVTAENLA